MNEINKTDDNKDIIKFVKETDPIPFGYYPYGATVLSEMAPEEFYKGDCLYIKEGWVLIPFEDVNRWTKIKGDL